LAKIPENSGAAPSTQPSSLVRWIQQAKNGDIGAYQRVYEQCARRVLNFIYRMVNSIEDAEDLTQETFVLVYQKLDSLKDDTRFEPWLFRIARNLVYQRFRGRPPVSMSLDDLDEDGQPTIQPVDTRKNPDEAFISGELETVVSRVINSLPPKYREVFVLSAIKNLSYQEISDIVGRSLPSVKTDIHRARLEVRRMVKGYLEG